LVISDGVTHGGGMRKLAEPRTNCGERAHKAAGLQQSATRAPTDSQIAVESFLMQFVHVQEAIGRTARGGRVFDVFTNNSCAFFFTAAEQIAAIMMDVVVLVLLLL